jgi:hypothetical protein
MSKKITKVVATIQFEQYLDKDGLMEWQYEFQGDTAGEPMSRQDLADAVLDDLVDLVLEAVNGGRLASMVDVSFVEEED